MPIRGSRLNQAIARRLYPRQDNTIIADDGSYGPLSLFPLYQRAYMARVLNTRPNSLIGYWPLWEASGAVAADISGAGRNGSYTGVTFHQPGVNLIANPGFETAGAGGADVFGSWIDLAGSGAVGDEAVIVHGGAHAAKLTSGGDLTTMVVGPITTIPGATYILSFWVRGDGSNRGGYSIWDNSAGSNIVAHVLVSADATWTNYTRTFVAPAGCVSTQVYFYCPAGAGGIAYFDDVSLVATSPNGIGDGRSAPYFDGVNDYVNLFGASLAGAFNGAEGTLACWAKVSGAGVWTDGTSDVLINLGVDGSNVIRVSKAAGNNTLTFVYLAGGVTDDYSHTFSSVGWAAIAMTWSKSADALVYYVNGAQVSTDAGLGVWAGALSATSTTTGAQSTTPTNPFSGTLAHVALYNAALTPGEIAQIARV